MATQWQTALKARLAFLAILLNLVIMTSLPIPRAAATETDSDGDGIPDAVEETVGTNPQVKDNDIFTNSRLFVMQQYRDFLNREGDTGGIEYWSNQIDAGAVSRDAMILSFLQSSEFEGRIAPLARLYFAYFLRIPDYAGLQYWVDVFTNGASLVDISNTFASSAEFQSRYGSVNDAEFVALLYQNILGRLPDAVGLEYWVGQLTSGVLSRGEMMVAFSESVEYKATISNEINVTMLYVGMLLRSPDTDGFDYWVAALDVGSSVLELINSFIPAAEYRSRFLPTESKLTDHLTEKEKSYLTEAELAAINSMSAVELLNAGFTHLTDQEMLKASVYFKLADISESTDTTKLFRATTGVAALAFDVQPGGMPGILPQDVQTVRLQDIGDIIDAFGGSAEGRDLWSGLDIEFPKPLPPTSPSGKELQEFLFNIVRPKMEEALSVLSNVSEAFNQVWTQPVSTENVESDYGDTLLAKAAIESSLGTIYTLKAYNLDGDLTAADIQQFLSAHPDFLKLADQSLLETARGYLISSGRNLNAAINWMLNETDDQNNDFISLVGTEMGRIDETRNLISGIVANLEGSSSFVYRATAANAIPFFGGLDLRAFLPAFAGNHAIGFLLDPSFAGILILVSGESPVAFFSRDLNFNGTSDKLEDLFGNFEE